MKKIIPFTMLFMLSTMLSSCFLHYYKTNTQKSIDAATLQKLQTAQKYFILHFNNQVMALNKINIADNKLEADLIHVSQNHIAYINPNLDDKHHFVRRKYLNNAIMEVHLYYPETLDSNQTSLCSRFHFQQNGCI